ncbi:hypothetical protein [Acrocarpospora macrocephala]|nr:hypothetical protein [Acrocarpospora macrocephala]
MTLPYGAAPGESDRRASSHHRHCSRNTRATAVDLPTPGSATTTVLR